MEEQIRAFLTPQFCVMRFNHLQRRRPRRAAEENIAKYVAVLTSHECCKPKKSTTSAMRVTSSQDVVHDHQHQDEVEHQRPPQEEQQGPRGAQQTRNRSQQAGAQEEVEVRAPPQIHQEQINFQNLNQNLNQHRRAGGAEQPEGVPEGPLIVQIHGNPDYTIPDGRAVLLETLHVRNTSPWVNMPS